MKVFISSTYEDLKEYRQTAIEVVNRYKCVPLAMEFLVSEPGEPLTVCEKEVRECDIFIGIYAHRYEFIPKGEDKSITQLEYELAKKLGKDCLCFIVEEDFDWKKRFMEFEKQKELDAFLDKVKRENVCSFFTTVHDFDRKFSTSLGKLIAKRKTEAKSYIPLPPIPYIAHPYPLPEHFTGRAAEQAMLSNWFYNEKEPLLVMEAIGGMGKSALTWVWMQKEILEKRVEVEGVFWWSFYEAPFDTFLQQLACYVLRKKDEKRSLMFDDVAKLQAALYSRRFLLVLDGLERVLRGYSSMNAMFIQEKKFEEGSTDEIEWDKRQREPVHPQAAKFLQRLASGKTRTLITTRLMPTSLEELSGVKHIPLTGLSEGDAVHFLRSEGIKGTRSEMEQAGKIYDFHPLMLKMLSSAIKRSRTKDINEAFRFNIINRQEPQEILVKSFGLLTKEEQQVASALAVFRSVFTFEAAKALFPNIEGDRLWLIIQELRNLGFLSYNEKEDHFDFHPILRSFLYHNLTNSAEVHTLAVHYFQALPQVKNVVTLDDLVPVIELYHHLVKAKKFDEAYKILNKRIREPDYLELFPYHFQIELLKEFFPKGNEGMPLLKSESDQAIALSSLALAYSYAGQPAKAVPLNLIHIKLKEKNSSRLSVAIGLGNVTHSQILIGQFSVSAVHLRKENLIGKEIGFMREILNGHLELRRILAYQGRKTLQNKPNQLYDFRISSKNIFDIETDIWIAENKFEVSVIDYARLSFFALLQARLNSMPPVKKKQVAAYNQEALREAWKSLAILQVYFKRIEGLLHHFVQAYWLLGEALIQCRISLDAIIIEPFEIHFYDKFFQHHKKSIKVKKGDELTVSECCLNEALRRCRKANMVYHEPDILLALARLEWVKSSSLLPTIEENLKEAFDIAQRSGYRLKLADLHLFCGQVLLELKDKEKLFGFTAKEHLQKTKEYALDVSEFSNLYQSQDPDFYKGIPEYDMLKRGMTKEERIKNGYWIAYKIADELEKRRLDND